MEKVILVDEHDRAVGTMEKLEAHQKGVLHRAFSVFLFNDKGELLIQKRAKVKYHSQGLWTNTCCSHPLPGEQMPDAARRRLRQEMGIETDLRFAYKFIYKAQMENDLIEHEYDYIFFGKFNGQPVPDPAEVEEWKFIDIDTLRNDIRLHPENYTFWFKKILDDQRFTL